ncbi:MAG: hypothetical protein AAF804_14300, partial [Bacteroidota bacterium]
MNFIDHKPFVKAWLAMLMLVLMLAGCKNQDDPMPPEELGEYAMITATTNADGQTRAFYLQRAAVDNTETLDNSDATELSASSAAMIHAFDGHIYFSDYGIGKMEKWSIDEDNNTTLVADMNTSELTFQGNAVFKDKNTAFVGGISTDIIIFDPTTMQKTGTIDISAVSNVGKDTDFPQAGGTVVAEGVTEMLIRDNLLFVALMPLTDAATLVPG